MKQERIANWLKGIAVVLAVMVFLFFGALTYELWLRLEGNRFWGWIVFSWMIAVLCYVILFEFWNVCTQIGRDNSFSEENARSFHHMGICGVLAACVFAARLAWACVTSSPRRGSVLFTLVEIVLSVVFVVLCEALRRLIQCAYEVKRENELTI